MVLREPPGSPRPPPPVRFADESSKPVRALRSGSQDCREPERRRSPRSSAPSSSVADGSSSIWTGTRFACTSRRGSGSRRRTATRTSSASAISQYAETRAKAREMIEEFGRFVEVHIDASVDACAERDVKGLYAKAFSGEIKEFTGVSDPYEAPESPELRVDTESATPDESAQQILGKLAELGLVEEE